jgi:hypothetical protein
MKKKQQAFYEDVLEYILSIGALNTRIGALCTHYKIDTIAGELFVTLDEPDSSKIFSIYCRFEDEKKAAEMLGNTERLNKYSGKWNFHTTCPLHCLHQFKTELEPILITVPA